MPSNPLDELQPMRCVHCRSKLPLMHYHCPTCGLTVAEKIPDEAYTIELRITHNPTGNMLVHRGVSGVKDPLETVDLRRLLRSIQYRLDTLINQYPEPTEEDLAALPQDPIINTREQWIEFVRKQIRAYQDSLKTVSSDTLPSKSVILAHRQETLRKAEDEEGPLVEHPLVNWQPWSESET